MQAIKTSFVNEGNGVAIGNPTALSFDETVAVALPSIPVNAVKALIVMEASSTAVDQSNAAHYTETSGIVPTATKGMPFGHLGFYSVDGKDNLQNFRIIGNEAGKTHKLQITYFA